MAAKRHLAVARRADESARPQKARKPARKKTAGEGRDGASGVQSVLIVLGVMEYLALHESGGVTEIAHVLDATKARVHRHLRTLVAAGYARQDDGGERYAVGPRLVALAQVSSFDAALARIAKPTMIRVRDRLGHTVLLDKITPQSVEIIDHCSGTGVVEISVRRNQSLPLHASVAGKLALAFAEPDGRPPFTPTKLVSLTRETITDPDMLELELERIRKQGWAAAPEEFMLGVNCVGAPIFNHRGQIAATIALLDSVQFLNRRPSRAQIQTISNAAAEITALLALKTSG